MAPFEFMKCLLCVTTVDVTEMLMIHCKDKKKKTVSFRIMREIKGL